MLELIKSQRFQAEYQMYQNKIEKISDADIKNQATILLKTLVNEIKQLGIICDVEVCNNDNLKYALVYRF